MSQQTTLIDGAQKLSTISILVTRAALTFYHERPVLYCDTQFSPVFA